MTFAATEWIGVSQRSWGSCVIQLCGALGQCVLAGMIYFVRNWRLAQLITAALHAVIAIYIWCGFAFSFFRCPPRGVAGRSRGSLTEGARRSAGASWSRPGGCWAEGRRGRPSGSSPKWRPSTTAPFPKASWRRSRTVNALRRFSFLCRSARWSTRRTW